jgi:cytidylate kinase
MREILQKEKKEVFIMHITITGNLGSGKSTICRLLSEKYRFEIYSTGKIQRELARDMNMTTLELNKLMSSDFKYDHMIDEATVEISRKNRNKDIIFDSRLAWNFVEKSFRVFVSVSLDVAAERVMNANRGKEEEYTSFEEAKRMLAERAATEKVRYKEVYHLNYMDFSNYNLVIDSTYCTPNKIADIILTEAKEYEKENWVSTRMFVSPKRLLSREEALKEDCSQLQNLVNEYKKSIYAIGKKITVIKDKENYQIIEGRQEVKAACIADVPYVPIEIKN